MIVSTGSRCLLVLTLFSLITIPARLSSQSSTETPSASGDSDPLKRPLPPRKNAQKGESSYFKRWASNEVPYIITPEEQAAFNKLTNDAEREQFIYAFWERRKPNPDTEENEYKEEYYRRIAYANEHFGAGVPGWKTDRGRIYIIHGAPDSIDGHPAGGPYMRPAEEGGGQTSTYPFEIWRYRNLDGIGQEIEIEFVDTCGCGEYHKTLDRGEKDALRNVPGAGLTDREALMGDSKAERFRGGVEQLGASLFDSNRDAKEFERMEVYAKVDAPPPVKFKDLNAIVTSTIHYNLLPFDLRLDFVRGSLDTVLVPITIQVANRDLTYVNKDGLQHASLNIFGRLTTLTGRVVQTFEDPARLDIPAELLPRFLDNVSLYQQNVPLRPGRYRLDVVIKDVNGDKLGTLYQPVMVPDFSNDEKLSASTLILADILEPVAVREAGAGAFVIGPDRVRPRVAANGAPVSFNHGQKVNLWMQVYNLALDEKTSKPSAKVHYEVVNTGTNKPVVDFTESTTDMGNIGSQMTLEKALLPNALDPGAYELTIKVNDLVTERSLTAAAKFVIK